VSDPQASGPSTIRVGGEQPYDVLVGYQITGALPGLVGDRAETVVLIHAAGLEHLAVPAIAALEGAGYTVQAETVPAGEAAKDITVAAGLWSRLAEHRVSRSDAIVAVGGGAVSDLAGFVAATWLRGIRVVRVPTTLLAMTDAAVGGKTAINIAAGKNLVGAFWPPGGVLADLDLLATLPGREYVSGLAEVIKAGFIADPAILDLVESDPDEAAVPAGPAAAALIERAIRVKAAVVGEDLREAGPREFLNYGHTLAHAIERVESYSWRHGDAVSVGLVFAAELSRRAGRLDDATAARHGQLLTRLGLPTAYPAAAWPQLHETMRVDKKSRGDRLRFVVLDGPARPGVLSDPDPDLLAAAYAAVAGQE